MWPQLGNSGFSINEAVGPQQQGAQKMTGTVPEVCMGEKVLAKYFASVVGWCRNILQTKAVGHCGDGHQTSIWQKQGYFQEARP